MKRRLLLVCCALAVLPLPSQTPPAVAEDFLPPEVAAMMKKHRVGAANAGIIVRRLSDDVRLAEHRADTPFNPASVTKLITAMAALDVLGAGHKWTTAFATTGTVTDGVLNGDLYFIGGGDPYITIDRFLNMLNQLRNRGIKKIGGRLLIDDSYFNLPPHDSSAFDGAATKPYNVGASAVALNFKTQRVVFSAGGGRVRVFADPPNDNFVIVNEVKSVKGSCRNWRRRIRERLSGDDTRMTLRVSGRYSPRCGEQSFHLSVLSHPAYFAGVFGALWARLGGEWGGEWTRAVAPEKTKVLAEFESQNLLTTLWAMNKFSNNLIARHLLISLSDGAPPYSYISGQQALNRWLWEKGVQSAVIENGSGLSRAGRITPADLAHLLEVFWRHPYRAELTASLPIVGVDGTMRRRLKKELTRNGHFKTGSLSNVKSIGGYMRDKKGRWLSVVVLTKNESRGARLQDDIIRWAYHLP